MIPSFSAHLGLKRIEVKASLWRRSGVYNGRAYAPVSRGPAPPVILGRIFDASPLRLAFFFAPRQLILAGLYEATD